MSLKIVYTDVDGTLVGARGNFFRTAEGATTLVPARALVDLHDAGVPVVLVSGRTRPQLIQDSLLLGADGLIAELGGIVGWAAGGRIEVQPLPGVGDPASDALVERLCATFDIALYEPWHEGHEVDVLMRGHADPLAVDAWLATTGESHLRLRDNGIAGQRADEATPAHVFHLIPDGISKGAAVAWDLARRGIDPADALAVGDSASDLEMAAYVGSMGLVANALAHPSLPTLADNVFVTQAAMGLGWAEAVLAALARP